MSGIERKARRLFRKAFPWLAGWPSGWSVKWVEDLPQACGETCWTDKTITICKKTAADNPRHHLEDTLIHEMLHMLHGPSLSHGRSFSQRVRWAKKRAGVR